MYGWLLALVHELAARRSEVVVAKCSITDARLNDGIEEIRAVKLLRIEDRNTSLVTFQDGRCE